MPTVPAFADYRPDYGQVIKVKRSAHLFPGENPLATAVRSPMGVEDFAEWSISSSGFSVASRRAAAAYGKMKRSGTHGQDTLPPYAGGACSMKNSDAVLLLLLTLPWPRVRFPHSALVAISGSLAPTFFHGWNPRRTRRTLPLLSLPPDVANIQW